MLQKEIALNYATNGIKVFPCAMTKNPIIKKGKGFKDATTDLTIISKWWDQYPDALIGSPNDQFTVIDSDEYDLCFCGKMLHDMAMKRLSDADIITDDAMTVKTISGGTHIYLKKEPLVTRSIKCLPSIDLLAIGGYVILPDQKSYVAKNTNTPWEKIKNLPKFKYKEFSFVVDDLADANEAARKLSEKEKKKQNKPKAITKEQSVKDTLAAMKLQEDHNIDMDKVDDTVRLSTVYKATVKEFNKVDGSVNLLVNGKLSVSDGDFNSETINNIFHNYEIQKTLGKFLGLKVNKERSLQRSIIPNHGDTKPSMGVRWSSDKTHIIVRDFANYFGNRFNQCDYNIVRLFASIKYQNDVGRLSPTEFVVWFTRLLQEANLITLDVKETPTDLEKLNTSEKKVLESFYLLDACKRLYSGYSGTTVFSDKFCSAWSGVSISIVGRIKKKLVSKGYLEYAGIYDCSAGKRSDGFFETPLYQIATETKKLKIDGFVQNEEVREFLNKKRLEKTMNQNNTEKMEDRYPEIATVYALQVSAKSYDNIINLAEDFDIPNIPLHKNMILPLFASTRFIEDVIEDIDKQFFIKNMKLFVHEDDDRRMLICEAESTAIDELWTSIDNKHGKDRDDFMEESIPSFTLSYDIGDVEIDLSALEIKLNEYTEGVIMLSNMKTHYPDINHLDDFLDGISPD
ncbi:hypothetical protein [Alishewanella phage vB_AspM_Slicko01]|nr:hypothetical protein [Alishewanella phage vB_AspM_Slicko01]